MAVRRSPTDELSMQDDKLVLEEGSTVQLVLLPALLHVTERRALITANRHTCP